MRVEICYFGGIKGRLGLDSEGLELPAGATLADALREVVERHPLVEPMLPTLRFAVDEEFAGGEAPLREGSEVCLFPPLAGGVDEGDPAFGVLETPLSIDDLQRAVTGDSRAFGGLVSFTGVVRDHSRGRDVVRLEYEAHARMATKVLRGIGAECEARWAGCRVGIHHRVGSLVPGDLAVVIIAASPHRAEAFEACRHAIERVKADVPVWKREISPDGAEWVGMGS
jgi:molybdopterin synthase catalytic subunit/molybdopterin converting factor small subunit